MIWKIKHFIDVHFQKIPIRNEEGKIGSNLRCPHCNIISFLEEGNRLYCPSCKAQFHPEIDHCVVVPRFVPFDYKPKLIKTRRTNYAFSS